MEKMLTEAVMALSYQASRESSISPRHTMIARLISNAFRIADSNGLNLPLSNDERTFVKGAQELGKLAQKYQAAREYLSKDTKDLNSPEGRNAVCDLLAGNTVEKMLRDEQQNPKAFSDVQILMGDGAWSVKNIRAMISTSETRRAIGLDHIQAILEKPNSFKAAYVAKDIKNEMLSETMAAMTDPERTAQKQMERTQELEQANVNRMQATV
jgi:hypothetical protein